MPPRAALVVALVYRRPVRLLESAANRKSACTSRARKKAYVEEMTCANAQLRWRAQILELLPDITIAVRPAGDGAKPFDGAAAPRAPA